jgi:predicted Zn-dependent protease
MRYVDRPHAAGTGQRPLVRRGLAALLALALALPAPLPGLAQDMRQGTVFDSLPRIGAAAADELSPQLERDIGEAVRRDFRRQGLLIEDPEVVDYLNQLGDQLGATGPAAGHSFELFAVRDATLNAFAVPGGFIGVHSGLIVAASNESELASVIGHEMGHVTQRHIARMLAQNRQTSVVSLATAVLAILAARSNPQAAGGLFALGEGIAQDQMLAFSRDAEREADRVGLEILRQADFDPNAMVAFFGRLQDATRIYDSGGPTYMRTHPVTSERMADIQNRLSQERYRQHVGSVEFTLVRAKLEAMADTSIDGLARARASTERRLRDRSFVNEAAAQYQLALVANEQDDFDAARSALAAARKALGAPHAMLARLAIDIDMRAARLDAALSASREALEAFPASRALVHQHGALLLRMERFDEAAEYLQAQVSRHRDDSALWRMLSEARFGAGQPVAARRAVAEHYALDGGLLAAIEQLRIAQREAGGDFYVGSQIDARLRELQARYTREREAFDGQ